MTIVKDLLMWKEKNGTEFKLLKVKGKRSQHEDLEINNPAV